MLLRLLIGIGVGALFGGLLGSTRSCETGGCPLTANPMRGTIVGGLMGLMLAASMSAPAARAAGARKGPRATTPVATREELATSLAAHEGAVLVVFSAAWCPTCVRYEPAVEAAAAALAPAVRVYTVDTDAAADLAAQYGIKYLPTSIVFHHGTETARFVGAKETKELEQLLGGPHER
jgi:thioredoxin-like negative regulator of GroEL